VEFGVAREKGEEKIKEEATSVMSEEIRRRRGAIGGRDYPKVLRKGREEGRKPWRHDLAKRNKGVKGSEYWSRPGEGIKKKFEEKKTTNGLFLQRVVGKGIAAGDADASRDGGNQNRRKTPTKVPGHQAVAIGGRGQCSCVFVNEQEGSDGYANIILLKKG